MSDMDRLARTLEHNFSAEKRMTDGDYATVNVAGALMAIAKSVAQVADALDAIRNAGEK